MKSRNEMSQGAMFMKAAIVILGICTALASPIRATTTTDTSAAKNKAAPLQGNATLHRVLKTYPVDRAKIENLQRWVNSGHEAWSLQPDLVASEMMTHEAPHFAQLIYEETAFNVPGSANRMREVFTFHSLDGRTSYRITVRRYRWLRDSAGSVDKIVWVPESLEIVNENLTD